MSVQIDHVGFLTPGNFSNESPFEGIDATLDLISFGERLGYDSAWVRQRHLEPGVGTAAVFLAAASQRTHTIQLGTAVIQIGYESPFRLAEDLSFVDVLSRGRLNIGLSAGVPPHAALIGPLVHDGDWQQHDLSHARLSRFADNLRGTYLGDDDTVIATPFGPQRPRLQPYAKGLADRLWYGGGSLRSAQWAGENGFNLLLSNVTSGENTDDFHTAQLRQIDRYLEHADATRHPRIALGRVIVPTDGADVPTRQRYAAYAEGRYARTLQPNGAKRTLFPRDLVGSSEQIVDWLLADPVLSRVSELRLELPYEFTLPQYEQILTDFITRIAPAIGWAAPARPVSALRA